MIDLRASHDRSPIPGDLCALRVPHEFVVGGRIHLWSLSERRQYAVLEGTPALVLDVECSRIPQEPGSARIMMALAHIDGQPFSLRADWLLPL
jgi:hypothetical protein